MMLSTQIPDVEPPPPPHSPFPVSRPLMEPFHVPNQLVFKFIDHQNHLITFKSPYESMKIRIYACTSFILSLMKYFQSYQKPPRPLLSIPRTLPCPFYHILKFLRHLHNPCVNYNTWNSPLFDQNPPLKIMTPKLSTDASMVSIFDIKSKWICDFSNCLRMMRR